MKESALSSGTSPYRLPERRPNGRHSGGVPARRGVETCFNHPYMRASQAAEKTSQVITMFQGHSGTAYSQPSLHPVRGNGHC